MINRYLMKTQMHERMLLEKGFRILENTTEHCIVGFFQTCTAFHPFSSLSFFKTSNAFYSQKKKKKVWKFTFSYACKVRLK